MKRFVPTALLGLVALVGVGLLSLPVLGSASAAPAGQDTAVLKRDEDAVELVLVADDDDDDTNNTNDTRDTGVSRSTRDHTRSNFTKVSRDRDLSRSDKTRDWTTDGPGKQKRDWSANSTNDRSRNDTRR